MPSAVVLVTEGFEEVEALAVVDFLRRASVKVTLAGPTERVTSGKKVDVGMDATFSQVSGKVFDALILPGGPGWANTQKSAECKALAEEHVRQGKWVCAICAAPSTALGYWGLLKGRRATCYPGMEKIGLKDAHFSEDRVVVDGKFITSRGPGTALEFALAVVEHLVGKEAMQKLKRETVCA